VLRQTEKSYIIGTNIAYVTLECDTPNWLYTCKISVRTRLGSSI